MIKYSLFNVKTNNFPCSCRGAQKDVGTIDLQVTYDANVITAVRKASVRLVHNNRKTEVRFLRASHVASGNSCLKKIVRDTYTTGMSNVRLSYVALAITSTRLLTL